MPLPPPLDFDWNAGRTFAAAVAARVWTLGIPGHLAARLFLADLRAARCSPQSQEMLRRLVVAAVNERVRASTARTERPHRNRLRMFGDRVARAAA